MLPEVKKYVDTLDAINAHVRELRNKVDETHGEGYREARVVWRDADVARPGQAHVAALELAATTENVLIKYIVENYLDDYGPEVTELLKITHEGFPAMEKMAIEAGWCGVWTDAVEKAREAGLIELDGVEFLTLKLQRELRREMGSYDADRFMKIVEDLVQARVKAATGDLAETVGVVVDALSG